MPAPRGGKRPGGGRAGPAGKKGAPGAGRPTAPRAPRAPRVFVDAGDGPADGAIAPRPFRGGPDYRVESAAGLRHEIVDLRAEVHRLAAEIDKLWARERGRGAAAPGRTARSIAGKPVRTGTRASKPASRPASASGPRRSAPQAGGPRSSSSPKRAGGAKRSAGWAKPKSRSRRSGTTPSRKGR